MDAIIVVFGNPLMKTIKFSFRSRIGCFILTITHPQGTMFVCEEVVKYLYAAYHCRHWCWFILDVTFNRIENTFIFPDWIIGKNSFSRRGIQPFTISEGQIVELRLSVIEQLTKIKNEFFWTILPEGWRSEHWPDGLPEMNQDERKSSTIRGFTTNGKWGIAN